MLDSLQRMEEASVLLRRFYRDCRPIAMSAINIKIALRRHLESCRCLCPPIRPVLLSRSSLPMISLSQAVVMTSSANLQSSCHDTSKLLGDASKACEYMLASPHTVSEKAIW